ncbi:uncharacterized protein LOC144623634 [Crassostrea virginica]
MKRKLTKISTCSSSSGKERFREKTWDFAMELNLLSSVQIKDFLSLAVTDALESFVTADYQTPQLPCQWKHSDLHMKKMQIVTCDDIMDEGPGLQTVSLVMVELASEVMVIMINSC